MKKKLYRLFKLLADPLPHCRETLFLDQKNLLRFLY
jgi:hypothetical protein